METVGGSREVTSRSVLVFVSVWRNRSKTHRRQATTVQNEADLGQFATATEAPGTACCFRFQLVLAVVREDDLQGFEECSSKAKFRV